MVVHTKNVGVAAPAGSKSILLNPEEPDGTYGFEFENCVD